MANKRRFADGTTVHASDTQSECRKLIERYGGDLVSFGWRDELTEAIAFRWRGRFYRFEVQHPPGSSLAEPPGSVDLTNPRDRDLLTRYQNGYYDWKEYARREVNRRWRVLLKLILEPLFKLALEEDGLYADQVFLPYALLPDGSTVGEQMEPQLIQVYETGHMPALPASALAIGEGR